MLVEYGYGIAPDVDIPLATVVTAFQRHFRPERVDGIVDSESHARLADLLRLKKTP
jgi:N-acetylmuramoyl-L-alanine amidase